MIPSPIKSASDGLVRSTLQPKRRMDGLKLTTPNPNQFVVKLDM